MAGQRELFRVTVNGGITVSSGKGIGPSAAAVKEQLDKGRTAYVRRTADSYICVTFKPGLPPEATANNQLGDQVPTPGWAQSFVNFIINP